MVANADTLVTARSIRQPIETYDDINNAFDGITYEKGAAGHPDVRDCTSARRSSRRACRTTCARTPTATPPAADFLAAISEVSGQDVVPAFDTFLDQSGVPRAHRPAFLCTRKEARAGAGPAASLARGHDRHQRPAVAGACLRAVVERRKGGPRVRAHDVRHGDAAPQRHGVSGLGAPQRRLCRLLPAESEGQPPQDTGDARPERAHDIPETVGLLGDVEALVKAGRFPAGDGMELSTHFAGAKERWVVEQAIQLATLRPDFLSGASEKAYPRLGAPPLRRTGPGAGDASAARGARGHAPLATASWCLSTPSEARTPPSSPLRKQRRRDGSRTPPRSTRTWSSPSSAFPAPLGTVPCAPPWRRN